MNINDFYNKKCEELGWEDFGDFLDRMTVANIRDCVFLWTKEYADLVNGQTKQPEKALAINGVVVPKGTLCEHEPLHSATETVDYCPACGLYQPSK